MRLKHSEEADPEYGRYNPNSDTEGKESVKQENGIGKVSGV